MFDSQAELPIGALHAYDRTLCLVRPNISLVPGGYQQRDTMPEC